MKNQIFANMLEQPHLLIAGTTGSGKSVLINGLMVEALEHSPNEVQFILIDPKRVELIDYVNLPHTLRYADEPSDALTDLRYALDLCETRFRIMQEQHIKKSRAADLYVVIDELADLVFADKRVLPVLTRIAQIGRAARVHLIAATQCPLASVLTTPFKVNMDARVGLRTRSSQDSRNLLEHTGCEELPRYGRAYYRTPEREKIISIPNVTQEQIDRACEKWYDWYTKTA